MRILLINRHTGTWLSDLDTPTEGVASELQRTGHHLELHGSNGKGDGGFGIEQRLEHARVAYHQFRKGSTDAPVPEDLVAFVTDNQIDSPLLVHTAALLAARNQPLPHHGPEAGSSSVLRDELLQRLLRRERVKHWDDHRELSLTAKLPSECDEALHALAIVNLTQPDLREIDQFLTASTLWEDAPAAKRRAAANAIYSLYPGPPRPTSESKSVATVAALEPDLISEFLISTLEPADLSLIVKQLHELKLHGRHIDRMLHLAALTDDHYPHISNVFDDTVDHFLRNMIGPDERSTASASQILATRLEYLVKTALSKSSDTAGQSMLNLLTTALHKYDDDTDVAEAAAHIDIEVPHPAPSQQTGELALRIAALAVRHFERVRDETGLARHLSELGRRLDALRLNAEALPNLERAEQLYKALAVNDIAHISAHGDSLRELGTGLGRLGRHREALEYSLQAVERFEALSMNDNAYLPDLANSLVALATELGKVDRHDEALSHYGRAVQIFEALAMNNEDHLSDLASSMGALGHGLSAMGRHREALHFRQRAVSMYEALATNEESHLLKLATSLGALGFELGVLGDRREALSLYMRAVKILETQATGSANHLPLLADSLNNLGTGFSDLKQYSEALPFYKRAIEIYEALASEDSMQISNLVAALTNYAFGLSVLNRHDEASLYLDRATELSGY